jgi:hypothetical protein
VNIKAGLRRWNRITLFVGVSIAAAGLVVFFASDGNSLGWLFIIAGNLTALGSYIALRESARSDRRAEGSPEDQIRRDV